MNSRQILRKTVITYLGSVLFGLTGTGSIYSQQVTYTGSLQYSTGSYFFTERTKSLYFVNGFALSGEYGRISLNVPYVIQSSPWVSYSPEGGLPTGGMQHGKVGRQGSTGMMRQDTNRQRRHRVDLSDTTSYRTSSFSDPGINGAIFLYGRTGGSTSINLNTSIKIPMANPNNGFGTGAWDFGAGLSIFQSMRTFFLFGDATYIWLGDMDELKLNNAVFFNTGVSRLFANRKWMASASISGSTQIIEDFDPPKNLNFSIGHFLSVKNSLSGTMSFGLTESSSDFSLGVGWSIRF